jgi:hypothetical protein
MKGIFRCVTSVGKYLSMRKLIPDLIVSDSRFGSFQAVFYPGVKRSTSLGGFWIGCPLHYRRPHIDMHHLFVERIINWRLFGGDWWQIVWSLTEVKILQEISNAMSGVRRLLIANTVDRYNCHLLGFRRLHVISWKHWETL